MILFMGFNFTVAVGVAMLGHATKSKDGTVIFFMVGWCLAIYLQIQFG